MLLYSPPHTWKEEPLIINPQTYSVQDKVVTMMIILINFETYSSITGILVNKI